MKKRIFFSFCFMFILLSISLSSMAASAASEEVIVSHGILVLADDSAMAMAGIRGDAIRFEPDDFARSMNLSSVSSITVTEIPPITDGELTVGATVITAPQTISAENISLMSYTAKSAGGETSYFRFRVDGAPYDVKCDLYMLDKANSAPVLDNVSPLSLNVSTYKNVTLYGTLGCYDPDADSTFIEIVSYPARGSLMLSDKYAGSYTYVPYEEYTGKDSFCYVARDKYGNYSASKTVTLTVKMPSTSVVYADMTDSPMYNYAIGATEAGFMGGTKIGGKTYFFPTQTVTRAEFTVMAMNCLGISEVTDTEKTVFADDAEIDSSMKGYIASAYKLGYIKGSYEDSKQVFRPNDPITRAEAAVIICNMIDTSAPTSTPFFEDSKDIPAFALSAVNSLSYMGVITPIDGYISANSAISRAETAQLLCAVMSQK